MDTTTTERLSFHIVQNELMQVLRSISGVIEQSQIMPILSHVHLTLKDSTLTIISSDGAIYLKSTVALSAPCNAPFSVAVSCKKLLDICRTIPQDATMECTHKEGWFTIKALSSTLTLSTLPTESFPKMQMEEESTTLSLPSETLKFLFSQSAFSMAQQDVRFFLNGVRLSLSNERLIAAATDGHRLAMCESSVPNLDISAPMEAIIPRKAVHEMIKLLDIDQTIQLKLSKRHLMLQCQNFTLMSSLLEGQYPEVQQLLPQNDHGTSITLPVSQTKQALQQAAILSHEKFRAVELSFCDHALTLLAHNAHQEKIQNSLPIDYTGEPIQMGFNISYLIEALGVIEHPNFTLTLLAAQNCAYIKEDVALGTKQFVIMSLTL